MYKHQTNSLPHLFSDYFVKHSQVHNYSTRNAQDYSIYKVKKTFSDRAIRITSPTLWNFLDPKLKVPVFMYMHQTKSLPQLFSDYFVKHSQVHNYSTSNLQNYSRLFIK